MNERDEPAGSWYDDETLLAAVAAAIPDPGSSYVGWLGRQAYTWRTTDDELLALAIQQACPEQRSE
jgi:hypothetical protein